MGDIVRLVRKGKFIGWYVRYKDVDGRRKMRASHQPSKELARRYLLAIEGRIARGQVGIEEPTPPSPTLNEVVERFLNEYTRARHKNPAKYKQVASVGIQRATAILGKQRVDEISSADVNQMRAQLSTRYAPRSIRATMAYLSCCYNWAIGIGIAKTNPVKGVEKPVAEEVVEYLTKEEISALLATARKQADEGGIGERGRHACVHFALHTGLRKGELLGLRWTDVDLDTRRLTVAKSYDVLPKGNKPRHLRLPAVVVPVLAAWRRECPRVDGLVFPVPFYAQFSPGNAHSLFGLPELLAAAGCRSFERPFHALRHTFASHFVMQGGNILTLQKILGHSDLKMTLVYAHLAPDFLAGEMDRLKLV